MLKAMWPPGHHEKMSVDLLEDILGGEQSHIISRYLNWTRRSSTSGT